LRLSILERESPESAPFRRYKIALGRRQHLLASANREATNATLALSAPLPGFSPARLSGHRRAVAAGGAAKGRGSFNGAFRLGKIHGAQLELVRGDSHP